MSKEFTVNANHVSPKYALKNVLFIIGKRVEGCGYIGSRDQKADQKAEFWAVLRPFGCGRSFGTPHAAIRDILLANGCFDIRITEV